MNKTFNSIRYADDFEMNSIEKIRMKKVLELIGSKSSKILDLGCGDGFIMEIFKKNGHKVEGIEIAKNAIMKARKKGFKVYDLSLIEKWSHEIDQKFDVVFCGEIIEHVFDTDLFLQEVRKVLKSNGSIIMTTPNIASLARRLMLLLGISPHTETTARKYDAGHIRYFTRSTLRKLLEENDFKNIFMASSVVNFANNGTFFSTFIAKLFPSFGNNTVLRAKK